MEFSISRYSGVSQVLVIMNIYTLPGTTSNDSAIEFIVAHMKLYDFMLIRSFCDELCTYMYV